MIERGCSCKDRVSSDNSGALGDIHKSEEVVGVLLRACFSMGDNQWHSITIFILVFIADPF